jgi:Glycosyl transferase 4-like domain/Glycosyl transferases group 1
MAGSGSSPDSAERRMSLLCISQSFSPDTTPTAIRASKLLERLSARWDITVLTESQREQPVEHMRVEVVRSRRPKRTLAALRRLRLAKLLEMAVWPDESIFWLLPAVFTARRIIREIAPNAIIVFMMPYSAGLAGIILSRLSGLPLILNLDDSPTCSDMHPHFPSRLHYHLAKVLENFYVRRADAVIYVSQTTLDRVRSRQPPGARRKLHLIRYGADREVFHPQPRHREGFEIAYVGAMTGWWSLIEQPRTSLLERAFSAWTRFGRYELIELDQRTSSPALIGSAILDAITEQPGWKGRLKLTIYGNPYPDSVVTQALASAGVADVIAVHGPVPHDQIADIMARADLLFITLPKRVDGSPGGRISAKTYEYLMTDRPVLAAVSKGENRDYLADKPGVWLVEPDDRERMKQVIVTLAEEKFAGNPVTFDREALRDELSYQTRAEELAAVVRSVAGAG